MNGVTLAVVNITDRSDGDPNSVWQYSNTVFIMTTVLTSSVTLMGLLLNVLLFLAIHCSPNLKTPPNCHLLNICLNNLVLTVHALLALPSLYLNGVHVPRRSGEVLSWLQLFLMMNCLLQYWAAFVSIGYYRYKAIHHPALSLRVRKLIVSRSIAAAWVVSLLLALTFSLTSARNSAYLPCTLDPFRSSFYLAPPVVEKQKEGDDCQNWSQDSERILAITLVMIAFLLGLVVILISYYSICRTLNVAGLGGKCRVLPWPGSFTFYPSSPFTEPMTQGGDKKGAAMSSCGRSYRTEPENELFCVTGSQVNTDEASWIVHYHKSPAGDFMEDLLTLKKCSLVLHHNIRIPVGHQMYTKRPLTVTLSTGSTASSGAMSSSSKYLDFSDISLGADIVRLQHLQSRSALKKQTVRRERGSLSSVSKNSLVMLLAYLLCSLPLIVCQVPGSLSHLSGEQRVKVLLGCRLLFLLNSPVYPLWYLIFSIRVKKSLTRMCETFLVRFQCRQR